MSENLWRPRLESYLAVREAMGHSVRAERKLLGEFLDFVDQKGSAGPIRAEWALDWACMLSPRRGVGGQAGRLSVVRNFLTYLRAFIAETEVPHHGLLSGPNRRKPYLFSAEEIRCMLAATMELGPRNSLRPHTYNAVLGLLASQYRVASGRSNPLNGSRCTIDGHSSTSDYPGDQVRQVTAGPFARNGCRASAPLWRA